LSGGKWDIVQMGNTANRIIVPSFQYGWRVNYFISRAYDDNWIKYLNPPAEKDFIFNELYLDWNKDITIVEGYLMPLSLVMLSPFLVLHSRR
jgi:hypothetical protein